MYLELCHVSAARSLEQILFSQIHLLLYIPKSDVVLVTQLIGASVSEPHLGSSTRPLSVCLSIYIYIYIYIYIIRPSFLVPRPPRYAQT